jgi:hypothetical protein
MGPYQLPFKMCRLYKQVFMVLIEYCEIHQRFIYANNKILLEKIFNFNRKIKAPYVIKLLNLL